MAVFVSRRAPGSAPLQSATVRRLAEKMLTHLGLGGSELSIFLCDDAEIQRLNSEHRNKNKPTDVLSFPQAEFRSPGIPKKGHHLHLLGDVVISLDTAGRMARARKRPLVDEVRFLLAHGLLHLYGYDHATPREKTEMSRRTRELVRAASSPAIAVR
jgi:rRNA maturation RNase YbeY